MAVSRLRREMNDGLPALERGPDRIEIGKVGPDRRHAGDVAPIEGGELGSPLEALARSAADEAAHAGDENAVAHAASLRSMPDCSRGTTATQGARAGIHDWKREAGYPLARTSGLGADGSRERGATRRGSLLEPEPPAQ